MQKVPYERVTSRFALTLRKFLVFEQTTSRASLFPIYNKLLSAMLLEVERDTPYSAAERKALRRLAQCGLIIKNLERRDHSLVLRQFSTVYQPRVLGVTNLPEGASQPSDWLAEEFQGESILQFYSMDTSALEWILQDLQNRLKEARGEDLRIQRQLQRNILLLSRIWKISLHYEITEVGAKPEGGVDQFTFDPKPLDSRPSRAVYKERLGLAKQPNFFQLKRILASKSFK